MRPLVPLLVALLLVAGAGAVVSAGQSDEYSMSAPGEVEIPARSLTVDSEDYTVRAVGRVGPGDTIRVDVSAPDDAEYSVYLYNKNLDIEQTDRMSGSGRATFSTEFLSPGSYLAAVYDGEILDVYPVVVEGYRVTADAPDAASGEFDVNVSVADGALTDEPPQVQVVLGDDERSVRVTASRVADGEYTATVPTDRFDPDTYALYGVVRGEDTTEGGDQVILAVSDRHEVEVTETLTSTPTTEPSDDGSNGGDGGSDGGGQSGTTEDGEVGIEGVELLNESVATDETVAVRVDLANFDPARGRVTLNLTTDGTVLAERTVAVGASSERSVLVRATLDTPGTYPLAVNGRALGSVTVTAARTGTPPTTPTTSPARTPTPTPATTSTATPTATDDAVVTPRPTTTEPAPETTSGDGAGFGAAVAVFAVALSALAFGRR
jgi:hypothetical protein